MLNRYPFGQVNTANLAGVVWYLQNEITTVYSSAPRCPYRFNISQLHRFKIKMRVPDEILNQTGMHFGPRFAYDQGKCEGRCFPGNKCTGEADCALIYDRFGFILGCNRFDQKWPFPDMDTPTPDGVWYSLPLEGRCDGEPTGTKDCIWSYEHAGMLELSDLEKRENATAPCCNGICSSFWHKVTDYWTSKWRIERIGETFQKKYPELPELESPKCDFEPDKVYASDPWPREDPWNR